MEISIGSSAKSPCGHDPEKLGYWCSSCREESEARFNALQKLLGDLVSHLDGATMEEDACEVFCSGCFAAYKAAREWLDKNDPTWSSRRSISLEDLDA